MVNNKHRPIVYIVRYRRKMDYMVKKKKDYNYGKE